LASAWGRTVAFNAFFSYTRYLYSVIVSIFIMLINIKMP
jgi:hypothetical protein